MTQKEPKDWITVNHKHIPIYEGESKQDAVNRSIANNKNKSGQTTKSNAIKKLKIDDSGYSDKTNAEISKVEKQDLEKLGLGKPVSHKTSYIKDGPNAGRLEYATFKESVDLDEKDVFSDSVNDGEFRSSVKSSIESQFKDYMLDKYKKKFSDSDIEASVQNGSIFVTVYGDKGKEYFKIVGGSRNDENYIEPIRYRMVALTDISKYDNSPDKPLYVRKKKGDFVKYNFKYLGNKSW